MRAPTCRAFALAALLAGCGNTTGGGVTGGGLDLGPCGADRDCPPANPRCDKNSGTCVPCLPQNDNCPQGKRCAAVNGTYTCTTACMSNADCPKSDAGAPTACCNGACLDTSRDVQNCGGCGKVCALLLNATSVCSDGVCGLGPCDKGFADCDLVPQTGCEVNLASDLKNCGGCDNACSAGRNQAASCADRVCSTTCAMGFAHCSMNPGDGCEVDVAGDLKNCGACGAACGKVADGTPGCIAGKCVVASCGAGFADCNQQFNDGCEAKLAEDPAHCSACGKVCPAVANGAPGCKAGVCDIGACNMGFADCDRLPGNGCETAIAADARNCGACGLMCGGANSMQSCQAGVCTITMCTPGFADCDGQAKNGCEANTGTDPANCGGCGKVCMAPPNANVGCANAQCSIGACKPDFADCNMDPMDGCEADIRTPAACGMCGNNCPVPANASASCRNGVCGIAMCNMGFADCDNNPANGCEKNLSVDTANCGKCGTVCRFNNAVPACLNGQCGMVGCNMGFDDCDKMAANGCEVTLATDAKNCGACGNVCPMNAPSCVAGKCGGYLPVGPQVNVPVANLLGWSQCYVGVYSATVSLAQIQAACPKAKLMMACRLTNSQTLQLLGWAPRADVLFATGVGNVPHNANGIGWYYDTGASWGFALQGDVINRNSCDVKASSLDGTGGNGNLRLCWHTGGGNMTGGWRCGSSDTLNGSGAYERLVYHAD